MRPYHSSKLIGATRDVLAPLLLSLLVVVPLKAEVLSVSEEGFVSEHRVVLAAAPAVAYKALVDQVSAWWDAVHSFSGDAHAFSIDDQAGGCFCESVGGVSVQHMRVVNVDRGRSIVMQGGLGPLQSMAVVGSMSFTFEPHERGSTLIYRYAVGGYAPTGLAGLATPVDQVQLGQLLRLQQFLTTGEPLNK